MKKPDLIKQLANRINQPHVIESWINKIEKAAYNKGYKDAELKQFDTPVVSQKRELLLAYENYTSEMITGKTNDRTAKSLVNYFLANNCG